MDKRAFSKLPRPKVTKAFREMRKLNPKMKGIVTVKRMEINGEDTLILNCFKAEKRKVIPWFRTFCQEEDYITQDLTEKKTKWRKGGFDYLTTGWNYCDWWTKSSGMVLASLEDRETLMGYFLEWRKKTNTNRDDAGFEFDDYIGAYHQDIRDKRLEEKHRKTREKIDSRMEIFGDLPEDYQEFIEKTVFDDYNYFFYSQKEKKAYCTRCGHEYEIRKDGVYHRKIPVWNNVFTLKHNSDYICPHCGISHPIKAKSIGYGRSQLLEVNWSVLIQNSGESVLVRYFCHTKDFRNNFRKPVIETQERFRTIHTAVKSEDYEWSEYSYDPGKHRWGYQKGHMPGWAWPSEFKEPRTVVLYNKDDCVLTGTCMKYSCLDLFIKKVASLRDHNSPWIIDQYFNTFREKPFIEQMIKIGWFRLVKEYLDYGTEYYNKVELVNGRTIAETLGLTREQFLVLREGTDNNPTLKDLKTVRYAAHTGKRITAKDLESLRYLNGQSQSAEYEQFIDATEYTTIQKLCRYMNKQKIAVYKDYFDFVGWIQEMGYDMGNEFNIYPGKFVEKHDEMADAYTKFKDKKHREDVKKFNRLLKKLRKDASEDNPVHYKALGLFIRLPYETSELKKEGETLHHCVGTYIDRVIKGETAIFFIRKLEEPDKPYYTLEWKDHQVVQCRGLRNCDMTPEVKAFTEIFGEQMKEYETRKGAA